MRVNWRLKFYRIRSRRSRRIKAYLVFTRTLRAAPVSLQMVLPLTRRKPGVVVTFEN